jgi:undecaprenyl-phosphate 4-deoxy-4-formamido-L-arabinose transferase
LSKQSNQTPEVALSVIIPVQNDEAVLPERFERLYPALDALGIGYEAVFVDDGSRDRSVTLLRQQYKLRPDATRVLLLCGNVGRQGCVTAGFKASKGGRVVTLDADPQGPPEEIAQLLAGMERGHDYVGGIRHGHPESKWLDLPLQAMNRLRERITGVRTNDPGCTLRAYDRRLVDAVLDAGEARSLIPALGSLYASNPTEIELDRRGQAVRPLRLLYESVWANFDLMTGLSRAPLRIFSAAGIAMALISFLVVIYLFLSGLFLDGWGGGTSILLGILFLLAGVSLFGIGLLGEYIARIHEQSGSRPGYPVREHLRPRSDPE